MSGAPDWGVIKGLAAAVRGGAAVLISQQEKPFLSAVQAATAGPRYAGLLVSSLPPAMLLLLPLLPLLPPVRPAHLLLPSDLVSQEHSHPEKQEYDRYSHRQSKQLTNFKTSRTFSTITNTTENPPKVQASIYAFPDQGDVVVMHDGEGAVLAATATVAAPQSVSRWCGNPRASL